MQANESGLDRVIRLILGVALVLIGLLAVSAVALKVILIVVGVILVITAGVGFCPLYGICKFSTKR